MRKPRRKSTSSVENSKRNCFKLSLPKIYLNFWAENANVRSMEDV